MSAPGSSEGAAFEGSRMPLFGNVPENVPPKNRQYCGSIDFQSLGAVADTHHLEILLVMNRLGVNCFGEDFFKKRN